MHIVVIGSGAAGLAVARHAKEAGEPFRVTVFEQSGHIGGTWTYKEKPGADEYGVQNSNSMYANLIVNGPKEMLAYPDEPFPADDPISYVSGDRVQQYLSDFAVKYELCDLIKHHHKVERVEPIEGSSRWQLTVRNLVADIETNSEYDAVFVCNGHFTVPVVPDNVPGTELFEGQLMHSQLFRRPEPFAGKSILLIGAGPSALDISMYLRKVATKVAISASGEGAKLVSDNFTPELLRPNVKEFTKTGVRFEDGHDEQFDVIIWCTGYAYEYRFLSKECGISVNENHVQSIFMDCVSIEKPTMFFIGLTSYDMPFVVMDRQAVGCLALLRGQWELPSKLGMYAKEAADLAERYAKGYSKRQSHQLRDFTESYLNEWTKMAKIEPVRPVLFQIMNHAMLELFTRYEVFRLNRYRILDDTTFECDVYQEK